MRGFGGAIFGIIFGLVWVSIWIVVVVSIIKAVKRTNHFDKTIKTATDRVFKEVDKAFNNGSVHTGNPGNPYYKTSARNEQASADNFSEVKENDSDSFDADLNPRSTTKRVYRTKTQVNGKRVRGDRSYSVSPSERPAHGKLSKESRDDEKEWF